MLNLMEDERNKQLSEEQVYQAEASEKPIESVYKPRSLIFERQPTRYAWFALDSSDDLNERDGIWKKVNKRNNISQHTYDTQTSGDVSVKTFKRQYNTNSLPCNKITEYNADKSETNITYTKQITRKRSIQKTNEIGVRYRNKRIHLKQENLITKENSGQERECQDKNEITKDEVTPYQVAKTTAEESLKFEDIMEHRKNPPLTETQNYLEHNDITSTITSAEQHSQAHVLEAKSYDSSDRPTETKYDLGKQEVIKLCTSPEPADLNNHFMNATESVSLEKSEKTGSLQSQCLETNKGKDKNIINNDPKENRIFGRTSDNLNTLNTEAVKFSFGTNMIDTPHKEAIVFSARDRQKNQNEADGLKQNTLKLRKPEETTLIKTSDINECNDTVQATRENVVLSNEYLSQEQKENVQIKTDSDKEILSQSIKPLRKDKYDIQWQNDVTVRPMVMKEQTEDSENQHISNKKDMTTFSNNPDTNAENTETICKTCLALQEAEKFNYKSFSVVIDSLTEVNQNPSKGDCLYNEKQDATKTESQNFIDKTVCGKSGPYDFTDTKHEINNIPKMEKCISSAQKGIETTKLEQVLTDDAIVFSSADKNVGEEHIESSTIPIALPAKQDSVEPKYSISSEKSEIVENDSHTSAESVVAEQQTKVKKHKHGWFTRLFSKLHKRKMKKVIESDIVSTPSKSCS